MRIRWRLYLKKLRAKLLPLCAVLLYVLNKFFCLFLLGFGLFSLVWWVCLAGEPLCDGEVVQKKLCQDFKERGIAGSWCSHLCNEEVYKLSGCDSNGGKSESVKTYQLLMSGSRTGVTAFYSDPPESLAEGIPFDSFSVMVKQNLHQYFGQETDVESLSHQLYNFFDINGDAKLDYGEAHSLWKLLHQRQFLNNYVLQDTGAVPVLNGSCGGLSLWSDYDRSAASPLYRRNSLWPFSILFSNAYRMTLPNWSRRAKVMLSLVEFTEDVYETSGVRFHLCNLTNENLFYYDKMYEVLISDGTGLMPASQIQTVLSNRTCHRDSDCVYSKLCSARCNASSHSCTGFLVRPTLVNICDIVEEYLMFDVPKALASGLSRHLRQCQKLRWFSPNLDIQHSVLLQDLKDLLWSHLQNKKL